MITIIGQRPQITKQHMEYMALLEKEIVIMPEGDIITEYGYHENGKLAWIKNPETGQKTHYSDENYTDDGWNKTITTPLGNVTEHHYNKEGQLVKEILKDDQKQYISYCMMILEEKHRKFRQTYMLRM